MSFKRSRAKFEADLHVQYALFGTPLPEEGERDDGSYLPLWKQDVRDEKGRRRLHGAFTGGWSAGYFNTVGSKEGWTPSTFVSSRTTRRRDENGIPKQSAEDYMDEEDLVDAAESQALKTSQLFAGIGFSTQAELRTGGLIDLFKTDGNTMGLKLLRRMGWKDGQGIGPKVRRTARLGIGAPANTDSSEIHLFAPDNSDMPCFTHKTDHMGLGFRGQGKLLDLQPQGASTDDEVDEDNDNRDPFSLLTKTGSTKKAYKGGIGMGVLNDNGSDDEDPYEIGPKIKYSRVVGGEKQKRKKTTPAANPSLKAAPVFLLRTTKVSNSLRKCQDGCLPLDGFVLARTVENLASALSEYAPPQIPSGWRTQRTGAKEAATASYSSTAEAAKVSNHDPRSRAAILGENSLPGKSVFDFLSASAREKLAEASGRKDLPPGLGEIPEGYKVSEEDHQAALWDKAPKLDRETALAAIAKSSRGPYMDDESKKLRYRWYLEHHIDSKAPILRKPVGMSDDDYVREINEFYNCARIFKPLTGFMASRFTTAKASATDTSNTGTVDELVARPELKPIDSAEDAAKMGMFGNMTRKVEDFFPTRLLCKRFNVKAPAHSRLDDDLAPAGAENESARGRYEEAPQMPNSPLAVLGSGSAKEAQGLIPTRPVVSEAKSTSVGHNVNPDRNDAVEAISLVALSPSPPSLQTWLLDNYKSATLSGSQELGTGPFLSLESIEAKVLHQGQEDKGEDTTAPIVTQQYHHLVAEQVGDTDTNTDSNGNQDSHDVIRESEQAPPPQYPISEASSSRPPPFSSLFVTAENTGKSSSKFPAAALDRRTSRSVAAPAYVSDASTSEPFDPDQVVARAFQDPVGETKRALPRDTKGEPSRKDDDAEPPPAYSEGDSPLLTFTYLMAAAGGASSIITQVQQNGPPINAIGDVGVDETITMDLRGTRFVLSRDELLTLPEFVLLSLFPNGLFPEGHMSGFSDNDAVQVDYDPASLQYMLDFFRNVAQSIPSESSPGALHDGDIVPLDPMGSRDDSSKRAGIIVLREDLDFYAIPPKANISQPDMIQVKRAAARALLKQDGIFSGLKRSDEPGTTEAHLIEMLTAGGFSHDDRWGHRAGEPNKAVVCSLALARLRSDIRGNEMGSNAVGMAQKLLLFWRKPARRCWWEGIELDNVEGVDGKLKVWIRRVWTLEMSVIGLR